MAVNPKKLRPYDEPPKARRPLIPDAPDSGAGAFLALSVLWLAAATGIGALWIGSLLFPEQLSLWLEFELPLIGALGVELSPSTLQMGFAAALVFGWLSNAGMAAMLFITPRVVGARLADDSMAFLAVGLWNVAVAAGLVALYIPTLAGPGLLTGFPFPVDGLMLLALLTLAAVFFRTLLGAGRHLPYVSVLFFGVALLALMGLIALGAGVEFLRLDETATALVNALVSRGILTYWVLGLALGALFYVVPRATVNPLASSGMALLSWLLWAAFAGLSALSALVDPSIPFAVTTLGNVGTMLLVAPIFLAVAALALTIHGRWMLLLGTGTVAFASVSMAFLLGTSLLEAIGALRSVQGLVSNTDWPLGVWLFATLGSATFAMFAAIDHAAPRILRRDWGESAVSDVQLWATFGGVTLAGLALMAGGIAHGAMIGEGAAAEQIEATLTWYRLMAGAGLGLAGLGGLAALVYLFLLYTTARRADYAVPSPSAGSGAPAGAPAAH